MWERVRGAAPARYAEQMAQFEVQTVDRNTGIESWTLVSAPTAESARERIAATGMLTGGVKLKSMDDPPRPETSAQKAGYGALCPACGTALLPRGRGIHGFSEVLGCVFLLLLYLIPGIIYYIWLESKPYCPNCKRRI